MRGKIVAKIAEINQVNKEFVLQLIESPSIISPFITKKVKGRIVIDKQYVKAEEMLILEYYKQLINSYGAVKFPNRSYIMTELMNLLPYLHCYKSYTVYKFDFKSFFYNIDPRESFKVLRKLGNLRQVELDFLNNYTSNLNGFIPGIGLHNTLVEIVGQQFDFELKKLFKSKGLLYYSRYVDDCILILDEKVSETLIESTISKAMKSSFGHKLNMNFGKKECYNSDDSNYKINYLGYVFEKGQSPHQQYKFGIAEDKLHKYKDKINTYILDYKDTQDLEVLNFRLELLFKRIVFWGDRRGDRKFRWQVRGVSDNYKELKRFMNNESLNKITLETQKLFNRSIKQCFDKNRVPIPPQVQNHLKNGKFIACFKNNKALLLHRKIGLTSKELKKRLRLFHSGNLENHNYKEMATLLLKEIK